MSQMISRKLSVFASIAMIVLAWACGDSRESGGQFNVDTGKHTSAVWLPQGHATAGTTACTECHGDDLNGGISKVSCSSCHLGGPTAVHPASWVPVYLTHGKSVSTGATTTAQCANKYCHGINLEGVTNSGPSCTSCHSMPYDPATLVCATCHSIPPSGTASPNRAGKHSKHSTSARTSCDICHDGSSAYAGNHSNGLVDLSFQVAYLPKSGGVPSYNASTNTCTNMSCHGAQATPSWLTGTLNVNAQCSACHAYGTTQYNSFNSGKHDKHVNEENIGCTICHDTAKLAPNHFTKLNTPAMEGPASATLQTQTGYNGNSCNPRAGGLSSCHNQETWW